MEVTNEEQDIVWEGYGLRLHIPPNSLPEGRSQFTLKMEVGLSGEFELPENGVLVSAVYSFSHNMGSEELHEPVIMEMEHCASNLDHLSFIKADAFSRKFEVIQTSTCAYEKGKGTIKLFHFSSFAIVKFIRTHLLRMFIHEYCCKIFYTSIFYKSFHFEACVIRKLEAIEQVSGNLWLIVYTTMFFQIIKEKIADRDGNYECGVASQIKFREDIISLDIPSTIEGWKMKRANTLLVYLTSYFFKVGLFHYPHRLKDVQLIRSVIVRFLFLAPFRWNGLVKVCQQSCFVNSSSKEQKKAMTL